jgi:sugar lactone lactonase YvrE
MSPSWQRACTVVWDGAMQLGEGLHWDAQRQRLWWVDIHGRRLFCWDLVTAEPQAWSAPQRLGWVLPGTDGDTVMLGLQQGFARARLGDELQIEWLCRPFPEQSPLRLNDAKADATGAVWAGSLNNDDESRPEGCLFRLGQDGQLTVHDTGYRVANGPAISPDGRWLLHTDSGLRTIYRFELDAPAGALSAKQVWKVFEPAMGYPDGMCFDADGAVWVAHWGAGCVSRFAPDGELLRRVDVPAPHVTNLCFGGPALDRLFVTTAWAGLSTTQRAAHPLSGALFELDALGVKGLPGRPCAGLPAR